jgi:hypothetical protein
VVREVDCPFSLCTPLSLLVNLRVCVGTAATNPAAMAVLHLSSAARASLILLALARLTSAQLTVQSACYNPDGALAQGNFPCFLDQKNSPCCGSNTICEDSGLCKVLDSVGVSDLIRGTCTDPTWSSPECPAYCLGLSLSGLLRRFPGTDLVISGSGRWSQRY